MHTGQTCEHASCMLLASLRVSGATTAPWGIDHKCRLLPPWHALSFYLLVFVVFEFFLYVLINLALNFSMPFQQLTGFMALQSE